MSPPPSPPLFHGKARQGQAGHRFQGRTYVELDTWGGGGDLGKTWLPRTTVEVSAPGQVADASLALSVAALTCKMVPAGRSIFRARYQDLHVSVCTAARGCCLLACVGLWSTQHPSNSISDRAQKVACRQRADGLGCRGLVRAFFGRASWVRTRLWLATGPQQGHVFSHFF